MAKLKPPKHLSSAARKLWKEFMDEYDLSDTAGLTLLNLLTTAWDEAESLADQVRREGTTIVNPASGAAHVHPALQQLKESRAVVLRCIRALNLDVEPPGPVGRPGGR
ncbi:hypothetical protein Psfp_02749 [Pelotomaculum sp. FP]|uniref:hypothetical protein n=1 Tax=Pelotomaculum sp. FP TaxID=261474 RepID=UPI001064721A|nr:hypothetical protein [Pelotomaculum sp. FP]TEB14608.1 hypothetical protein Psfp_02749 [Pelotomaculum sp. FP]